MGFGSIIKEYGSRLVEKGAKIGGKVLEFAGKGAVLLGWNHTAEMCCAGIDACERSREKWKERADRYQAENLFGNIQKPDKYRPDSAMRDKENACISGMENILKGEKIENKLRIQTAKERLDFMDQVVEIASNALGVNTKPVQYYIGEDASLGYYNREDDRIYLNEAFVTCDNIYLVKEQILTIFHETLHAAQWKAVVDVANGGDGLGFSEKSISEWAVNFKHYIRPEVDFEEYRNQPLERDTFGLEWRIRDFI